MGNNGEEFERVRKRLLRWDFLLLLVVMLVTVPLVVMALSDSPLEKKSNHAKYEPNTSTYLSPGKIEIADINGGDYGEFEVTIHNGNEELTEFALSVRSPDNIPDIASGEHLALPAEYHSWFTITELSPVLEADETRSILVSVQWPETIELDPGIYEVYISMVEGGQTGMVMVELAVRVIMTME